MSYIAVENIEEGICRVTLNRPEKRNALNIAMMLELCDVYKSLEEEGERVVILQGAGPAFCAGLDLKEVQDPSMIDKSASGMASILDTISQSPLITVAVVHGVTMAGGAGIMTASDYVISADRTLFGYPEVRRGLVAALVMPYLLKQVTFRHAQELLFVAEPIDSEKALQIGLVNQIVPDAILESEALSVARMILKGAPQTVSNTKALLRQLTTHPDEERLVREVHHFARQSKEAQEGAKAFLEKRDPVW